MLKKIIHIGTFDKPFGLRGEIKVLNCTSSFNLFKKINLYFDYSEKIIFDFEYIKKNKENIIIKIKNCNNRNSVEGFKGKKIFTYRSKLPKVSKKYFYAFDLINCKVITNQNKLLGKIIEINNFGAGDLLNVRNLKGQTFYIPMNGENIIKVDLKKKLVVSNPLKGILN